MSDSQLRCACRRLASNSKQWDLLEMLLHQINGGTEQTHGLSQYFKRLCLQSASESELNQLLKERLKRCGVDVEAGCRAYQHQLQLAATSGRNVEIELQQSVQNAIVKVDMQLLQRLFAAGAVCPPLDFLERFFKLISGYTAPVDSMLSLLLEHLYIDTGAAQTMQSLLRLFVERDWVQAVQRLIDYGVNYRFDNDLIFLLTALRGRVDIMRVLLDLGIDVNLKDGLALRQAVLRGQSAVVHLLLDHGARSADRALRWAAAFGDAELCGQLIDRGANVHTHQDRPVFEAVRGGFVTTVRVLLDRGANPTAKSGQAIKLARKNGNVEMVRLFDDWLINNSI